MKKGIYVGPPHYWHRYALNPRERYYYGYYGVYGPHTDLRHYEPIHEEFRLSDGCHNNGVLLQSFIGMGFSMVLWFIALTIAFNLLVFLLRR